MNEHARLLRPRPGLLDIAPYQGGRSSIAGRTDVLKLSSNEGALGPSPRAVAAARQAAETMHRYPDGASLALREAIGAAFGLDPERIVCGAGSDEILGLLARAYAGPGDEILHTEHGFLIYPIAALSVGATPVSVPETRLCADVDRLLAAAGPSCRLVYLANPNNPTGTYLPLAELRRLREGLPEHCLLVIDAAYAEYVTEPDYDCGAGLVRDYPNVFMTRTFSKIFGLGGLRLGWGYGAPEVIDLLNRLRMPFNVSALAQAAGIAALEDRAHREAGLALNSRMRPVLANGLAAAGLEVVPGVGNFVLARLPGGEPMADAADRFLQAEGIIVRRMGGYGLPDSLRITVGREPEVQAVIGALAAFMASGGGS